jgi:hypothetical protein
MLAQPFGALGDFLAAHRLVEETGSIGFQHPEVEAEVTVADEVARRCADEGAARAAAVLRLQDVERVDLGFEPLDRLARRAAESESYNPVARSFRDPRRCQSARSQ